MRILLFESSNAALWAEDIALEEEIAAEVVTAPAESEAKCGIALSVADEDVAALAVVLDEEGLPYRIWEPRR